jgi:hypothetical protein
MRYLLHHYQRLFYSLSILDPRILLIRMSVVFSRRLSSFRSRNLRREYVGFTSPVVFTTPPVPEFILLSINQQQKLLFLCKIPPPFLMHTPSLTMDTPTAQNCYPPPPPPASEHRPRLKITLNRSSHVFILDVKDLLEEAPEFHNLHYRFLNADTIELSYQWLSTRSLRVFSQYINKLQDGWEYRLNYRSPTDTISLDAQVLIFARNTGAVPLERQATNHLIRYMKDPSSWEDTPSLQLLALVFYFLYDWLPQPYCLEFVKRVVVAAVCEHESTWMQCYEFGETIAKHEKLWPDLLLHKELMWLAVKESASKGPVVVSEEEERMPKVRPTTPSVYRPIEIGLSM